MKYKIRMACDLIRVMPLFVEVEAETVEEACNQALDLVDDELDRDFNFEQTDDELNPYIWEVIDEDGNEIDVSLDFDHMALNEGLPFNYGMVLAKLLGLYFRAESSDDDVEEHGDVAGELYNKLHMILDKITPGWRTQT